MIHRIELENFKGHQHTTVPLGRMTALVGPNSSGKTSVLQALHFLGQLRQKEDTDIFLNENEPRFLVRNAQDGFSLRLQGSQDGQGSSEPPVPWTFLMNVKTQKHPNSRWDSHYKWSVSEAEGESRNWRDSLQNKNVPEPLAHQALEVLTTGEFLSAEGEEWVLGFSMDLSPKMRKKPKSLPI